MDGATRSGPSGWTRIPRPKRNRHDWLRHSDPVGDDLVQRPAEATETRPVTVRGRRLHGTCRARFIRPTRYSPSPKVVFGGGGGGDGGGGGGTVRGPGRLPKGG